MNSLNAKELKANDVVWAKLKGFPWWPAVVMKFIHNKEHVNDNVVLIKFMGDLTTAVISVSRLLSFGEHYARFSSTKHRQLLRAITEAKRIHSGEISFSQYCKSVKHLGNKRTRNMKENVDDAIMQINASLTRISASQPFNVSDVTRIAKEITQLLQNVREERNKRKIRRVRQKVTALLRMKLFAYDSSDVFFTSDNTFNDVCALKKEICELIETHNDHTATQQTQRRALSSIESVIVCKSEVCCNGSVNGSNSSSSLNCSSNTKADDDDDSKHRVRE